jgi:hypothetical protein
MRVGKRVGVVAIVLFAAFAGACGESGAREDDVETSDSGSSDSGEPSRDAAPGGKDAGPPMTSGSACNGKRCVSPAVCEDDKRCVCPDGYEDPKGDGSECKDIDECAERKSDCPTGAKCSNKPGSFSCECAAPAYKGDGKSCDCADGYTRTDEGLCLAEDGQKCEDNLDCLHNACEGGICCAQSCGDPGECRTAEGASCKDGKTCEYPVADDGSSCDDGKACTTDGVCKSGSCEASSQPTNCDDKNPCTNDSCEEPNGCLNQNNTESCDDSSACTSDDRCLGGSCQGTARDCSAESDTCNVGSCDPASGSCGKKPRDTSASCDDGNTCTVTDQCQAGSCRGTGNACGPNATACEPGSPNDCTCASSFVEREGRCVPTEDECQGDNPCSSNAECFDPSNTGGDVMCTCRPGYTGNGVDCTATDPCNPNPCGADRGVCRAGSAGSHTCECGAGFRAVGDTCVCDLSGDFGVRLRQEFAWRDVDDFIEDGDAVGYTYILHRHTYDANGELTIELADCGATTFDFCGLGLPPLLSAESYSQYFPVDIWGTPSMPRFTARMSLPNALPGSPFVSENIAMFSGISLTDPFGPFPASRRDIAGTPDFDGSAVNGAAWLDHDNDGAVGITTFVVPPGGVRADGTPPDPPQDFGANSQVCPRSEGGPRTPYAYLPAVPEGLSFTPVRIKRFSAGTRVISAYSGSIVSCNELSGNVTGPASGNRMQVDGRVGSCIRTNGSGEGACPASAVDFLDEQPQTQEIVSATFTAKRLAAGASCRDVISLNYD